MSTLKIEKKNSWLTTAPPTAKNRLTQKEPNVTEMEQPLLLLQDMVKGKQLHANMLVSLKTEPVTLFPSLLNDVPSFVSHEWLSVMYQSYLVWRYTYSYIKTHNSIENNINATCWWLDSSAVNLQIKTFLFTYYWIEKLYLHTVLVFHIL